MPTLTTDRLVLRAPHLRDRAQIARLLNDFEIVRWLARVPYPYSLSDAHVFVTSVAPRGMSWIILARADGAVLGTVGLQTGPPPQGLELGYWLGRRHHGQGFMTEAASAVIAYAAAHPGNPTLTAGYLPRNRGSARVLDKLGFARWRTGALRSRAIGGPRTQIKVILRR